MSGETEKEVSGWTVDTLKAHIERRLADSKDHLDERFAVQTKSIEASFASQQLARETALSAAERAVDKALEAAEKAVLRRQDTLDREFHEHLEQVRHETALAFTNSEKAVLAALASASEAVHKAEMSTDKRFEAANGFRTQLAQQAATFLPREVGDAAIAEMRDRITALTTRMDTQQGRASGYSQLYGWAIAGLGLIITAIILAISLTRGG